MAGRPRIYDRVHQVTTSIQAIFYDLAREKHISWKVALEAGIKLLAQGGDSPKVNQEIIQKHIKNQEVMTDILTDKENELVTVKKELEYFKCGSKKEEKKNKNKYHY